MASPEDVAMGQPRSDEALDVDDSHGQQPFTVEENIQQLNGIDRSIVRLMSHTATALSALTTPAGSSAWPVDPSAQKAAFLAATDAFLTTLHSVDVRMKRQVLALEEAGIVNLSNAPRLGPNGAARASLKPNGVGTVGNLDVGWLNGRSSRVERDMEAELWHDVRGILEQHAERPQTS